jgi:NTP pyrophosphatase (non-canonical NTP hydrolase)
MRVPHTVLSLLTHPDVRRKLEIVNWRSTASSEADKAEAALLTAEECGELIQAIIKRYVRLKLPAEAKVIEEVADVLLMVDQLVRQLDPEALEKMIDYKLDRTIERYHTVGTTYVDSDQI